MRKDESMRKKYDVPFNETIPLGEEKFDVSNLNYRHKICYFPKENSIVIKSGEFEELSKLDAPQIYPEIFYDASLGELYDGDKVYTASVQLNAKEMLFCRKHGKIATYMRSLIREEMKKENFK